MGSEGPNRAGASIQPHEHTLEGTDELSCLRFLEHSSIAGLNLDVFRHAIDTRLSALIALPETPPLRLNAAIRYSLLAPGKRIRPLLAMASAAHFGTDPRQALDVGCAIEMVHAASLVLDDLPSMDDATLRRGQSTTHRAFGEDMAMLTAVSLLNRAYGTLAALEDLEPEVKLELVRLMERAIGTDGLVAGQTRDLHERTSADSAGKMKQINFEKTGVLFVLAVESGARVAGIHDHRLDELRLFAGHLGCAFQIMDDVLDQSASATDAGKDVGKDSRRFTAASTNGLDGARAMALQYLKLALASADACPSEQPVLRTFVETLFAGASKQ
ncbi:polyprenyl synthetase family protein [Aquisalimonas sp.]|uniref:polyprenyl synthetase family protein n=1 Tax=Aquisalimonas sp. TaxID=1872621 RepID=UPI0025BAF3B5|nr:polyprenyl synthetase family protein [Aquisalimonas sp.]